MSFLNLISYSYARMARALMYDYDKLTLNDFRINLTSYTKFEDSARLICVKVFNLINLRLDLIE